MSLKLLPVNFFDEATISVSPAAVSTLPLANLQSNVSDEVWRSPNLDPQVISGTWGGEARPVSSWGLWPGKGAASLIGAKVRVQLYSDTAYATQVYDSGTLDFFDFSGTGWGDFDWGVHPWGVEEGDYTARLAPLVKFFTQVSAGSFRITITNGGAVDTPYFEARRFWLAQAVEAPYTARPGAQPRWAPGSRQERTVGGVLQRQSRPSTRELSFELRLVTEAQRQVWSDLAYYCDPSREIVLSLFPGAGGRQERDHVVLGSFVDTRPLTFQSPYQHDLTLSIVES